MFLTIAICTLNRAESLRQTVDSLAAMQVPSDLTWEIIIVNNNSTDHTDDIIDQYRDQLPLRREFEVERGHSNARNRAIDAARGEYIIWTDDDVVVRADWLSAYAAAFRRWPEAAVFGGRIIPRYEEPAVKWVVDSEPVVHGAFAIRDFGNEIEPLSIADNRIPYGANFAIRTKDQRAFRYDPTLGLAPDRRRYYDEVDVITRLLKSGAKGYWIPEAVVEHRIGQEKQTIRYLTEYYVSVGETEAFRTARASFPARLWFGVPWRLWPRLIRRFLRYNFHRLVSPAPVWVAHLQAYANARGTFRYWRQRKHLSRAVWGCRS